MTRQECNIRVDWPSQAHFPQVSVGLSANFKLAEQVLLYVVAGREFGRHEFYRQELDWSAQT